MPLRVWERGHGRWQRKALDCRGRGRIDVKRLVADVGAELIQEKRRLRRLATGSLRSFAVHSTDTE